MKKVFGIPVEKKADLIALLEADPYAEHSFARMGYKMKEAAQVGGDPKLLYLYISAEEKAIHLAGEKLKPLVVSVPAEMEKKVIAEIEKEEDNAVSGFGGMFG